jgi:hypothetical protein
LAEVWHGRHARRDVHVAAQSGRPIVEVHKGVVVHVPVGDRVALKPETDVRENLRGGMQKETLMRRERRVTFTSNPPYLNPSATATIIHVVVDIDIVGFDQLTAA